MNKVPCRYWIIIDDYKQGARPVVHILVREIKWSTGWGGTRVVTENEVERLGPFNSHQELITFYYANRSQLYGGSNARKIDQSMDGHCADQL